MLHVDIKEYLSKVGIRKITKLDTALVETFGQSEGERHIERLTKLFDQSEERLVYVWVGDIFDIGCVSGDGFSKSINAEKELARLFFR